MQGRVQISNVKPTLGQAAGGVSAGHTTGTQACRADTGEFVAKIGETAELCVEIREWRAAA